MAPDPRSDCPDRVTLERMAREESVSEATRTHVDGCGSCRGTLDELREENDLLRSALFAESAAPPTAGPGGQVVPGYELQGELHRGGQGVVYRARQLATNRPVAIKMMLQGRLATSTSDFASTGRSSSSPGCGTRGS